MSFLWLKKEYKRGKIQENIFSYQEKLVLTLHGAP